MRMIEEHDLSIREIGRKLSIPERDVIKILKQHWRRVAAERERRGYLRGVLSRPQPPGSPAAVPFPTRRAA